MGVDMLETRATQTPELGDKNGPRELALALLHNGPTQVGGMVTTVILVGQAFAQFNQAVAPYAAFLFSCLLAIYQVGLVQKATMRECLITVPIAAVILFALALGSNNSIAPTPENTSLKKELELVKEQLELRTKELENARQLSNELRRNLGLPPNPLRSPEEISYQSNNEPSGPKRAQNIPDLLGLLSRRANAQSTDLETERQRELREALRAYETRQQELQEERKRLQETQERLREEQQKIQQPAPFLWREW